MKYIIEYRRPKVEPENWCRSTAFPDEYDKETANKIVSKALCLNFERRMTAVTTQIASFTVAECEENSLGDAIIQRINDDQQTYNVETKNLKITVTVERKPKSKYREGQCVMILTHNSNLGLTVPFSHPSYRIDSGTILPIKKIYEDKGSGSIWLKFPGSQLDLPEVWVRALKPEEIE